MSGYARMGQINAGAEECFDIGGEWEELTRYCMLPESAGPRPTVPYGPQVPPGTIVFPTQVQRVQAWAMSNPVPTAVIVLALFLASRKR